MFPTSCDGSVIEVENGTIVVEALHLEGCAAGLDGVVAAVFAFPPAIKAYGLWLWLWLGLWRLLRDDLAAPVAAGFVVASAKLSAESGSAELKVGSSPVVGP